MTTRNFRVHNGIEVGDIVISGTANTIVGLATAAPSNDGDVANKKYVDDKVNITVLNTSVVVADTGSNGTITNTADGGAVLSQTAANSTITASTDITLAAGADVNIPVDVGLRFGDGGENIETNNTDFTITSGGKLNLSPDSDVVLPNAKGLIFGDAGEKIEGDGTDLTISSSGVLNLTATGNTAITNNATIGGNLVLTGNLTVNGSTSTVSTTNTTIADNIIELNTGISQSFNDAGIIIERGSTGNNAAIIFDESADKFAMGLTTATAADKSGGITVSVGTLLANLEGNVTGDVTGTADVATAVTVADESSDTSCNVLFTTAASGDLAPKSGSNLTFNSSSGVLTATGFAGALTGNVTGDTSGSSGSCTGNAATATKLATTRAIGGVNFDGTAAINLPGVNTSGNQDTSGTAAIATTVTVADESSDTSCNVIFTTAATGDLAPKSGTNLTFNSSSGVLTATGFAGALTGNVTGNTSGSSGSCTGNAATATALASARNIGGVSFDGTGNINLPGVNTGGNQDTSGNAATATALETARNIGGVSFDGTGNINLPGVNTGGNQDTSGTAAVATGVTVTANNTANEDIFICLVDGASGTQGIETDTGLKYNPSTNVIASTASAAQYADVAERFEADAPMETGSVVMVGGSAEITEITSEMSEDVFGVISHKPAYMMNYGAGPDETHPFVAMTGRTPVRVVGEVTKGQRLVTSSTKGCARAVVQGESISPFNVIGRALETSTDAGVKLINCAVRSNN